MLPFFYYLIKLVIYSYIFYKYVFILQKVWTFLCYCDIINKIYAKGGKQLCLISLQIIYFKQPQEQ